ncbi:MAG TPA: hypothetical protein VKS21_02115 [Spirochaetota bacterium]|nr:hypothetical protein [Spirochaetota bacterium]
MAKEKIFCANCKHCVVIQKPTLVSDQYLLRISCRQDKWKKKIGEIKHYKYFTAARRTMPSCDSYEPIGDDVKNYIKELRKNLPIKDEVYSNS